jgi:hypothetical protein
MSLSLMYRLSSSVTLVITARPRVRVGVCDRTTSKKRGLSPKIISGDSRRSENAQTHTHKHTVPTMKFKLKLLQIKCHVLGVYKRHSPKCASKDNPSFCGSVCLSR